MRAYVPELLLAGGEVSASQALVVADGMVRGLGAPPPGCEVIRLPGLAIVPGFVSAHSHAFQRAIRGRTELRAHPVDDFWSWREAMYAAAERLSPDDLEAVSHYCFLEMARAGITAVGEFHYLHRDPSGHRYADPNELDLRVLRAARRAGLRVCLLRVAYARAGFQQPENPRQRRFIEASSDEYLKHLDALAAAVRGDALASVGAAPHSVRACSADWIEAIAAETQRRAMPLHLHVSEQPGELAQCQAEHGLTPPLLLERLGALGPRTTAVHAVHLTEADRRALGAARAFVCACPTTERNLGDGVVRVDQLLSAGARICLGTDSQVQISPLEDARQLEYHLRLIELKRAVLDVPGEPVALDRLGKRLLTMASAEGMASLGFAGGNLQVGEPADFAVLDLGDPSLAGCDRADFAAQVAFCAEKGAVRDVYVAGEAVVRDRRARGEDDARSAFVAAQRRLWGT